jgi:hypothetical protein
MMQTEKTSFMLRAFATPVFIGFSIFTHDAYSQEIDTTTSINHIGGAVTVTNNGISLLPTFSLGKPALMLDMSVGNEKISFEPQFRFSLEGKPWAFIFWWRYKLINTNKFIIKVGAHPAIAFKTVPISVNGDTNETIVAQRYIAGEFSPNYFITTNTSIGIYYLHAHGSDEGATRSTHFITVNCNFSNIKLSERFFMNFSPQVYYLRLDETDGYYVTATLTFAMRDFPFSMQSIVNRALETNIAATSDFVWNVSLVYSFRKEYTRK